MIFFLENSSVLGVFGSRRELQADHGTVWKSAISPQPGNQQRIKWSNTAYLDKRNFMSNTKFCVSSNKDLILYGDLNFNAQPVKIPQFKSLLTRKQARWPQLFIAFF